MQCSLPKRILWGPIKSSSVKEKTITSITISTRFSLTATFPPALSIMETDIGTKQISLLVKLSKLVQKTYWWLQFQMNGKEAYKYVHGSMKNRYFQEFQGLSATFVNCVTSLCYSCTDVPRLLDFPNTHRLLQLVVHTKPFLSTHSSSLIWPLRYVINHWSNPSLKILEVKVMSMQFVKIWHKTEQEGVWETESCSEPSETYIRYVQEQFIYNSSWLYYQQTNHSPSADFHICKAWNLM